ncbi:MAG: endonuclease domain-containing protein [Parvularculaceae bacterium]
MADERARNLRKNATPAERALWRYLRAKRDHGWKFRRQHPLGPYYADFVCLEAKLVVELDGGHHADGAQAAHDHARDAWLKREGYAVLRFWNADALRDPAAIAWQIIDTLERRKNCLPL